MRGATLIAACLIAVTGFQSTHPVRGATPLLERTSFSNSFQSTHPVRGATSPFSLPIWIFTISIHAPRAGCDGDTFQHQTDAAKFQSTHPVRGATICNLLTCVFLFISIHAPRAGCDCVLLDNISAVLISIHAPRAGCDQAAQTHPQDHPISIHAPRAGCDVRARLGNRGSPAFQSTHPVRGATSPARSAVFAGPNFNPRTPCGVRHHKAAETTDAGDFNPRTPCGVRPPTSTPPIRTALFQSTHPVRGATGGHR